MSTTPNRRRFLQGSLAAGAVAAVGSAHALRGDQSNPPARPGRVRWHADFATACGMANRSGKPVFLFHMMGRLDEKFC